MAALDEVVAMLSAAKYGSVGKRGPASLPSGIGALRLVDAAFGSAAFYFTSGEGEAFQIGLGTEAAETETTSRLVDVADELLTLIEARGSDQVLEIARRYSDRVAAKYVQLLDVIVAEGVDTEWTTPRRLVELPVYDAGTALAVLEQTDHVSVEELDADGVLYEANARTRGFRLLQEDGRVILGRFEPKLFADVGDAWNHRVRCHILVRVEKLARSGGERRSFELMAIEILGPAE